MSLEQKIMAELKPAMLAKDEKTVRSLRAVKAAIIVAKTAEGASGELSADEEIKLLQKLVKQRKDSLDIFTKQNRPDLASKEQEEIDVIERFLPAQMSAEELKLKLQEIIQRTGPSIIASAVFSSNRAPRPTRATTRTNTSINEITGSHLDDIVVDSWR